MANEARDVNEAKVAKDAKEARDVKDKKTEEATEVPPKAKKGLKWVVLGGIVLVVGAGSFFLVTEVVVPMLSGSDAESVQAETEGEPGTGPAQVGVGAAIDLGEIVVNPAGTGGRRYIKVSVTLEAASEDHRAQVEAKVPFLKDVLIRELTSRTVDELTNPLTKDEMRDGMVYRVNQLFDADPITGVFFTEYVIQ